MVKTAGLLGGKENQRPSLAWAPRAAVPNIFGTRDRFCGRQFFHGPGWGWAGASGGDTSNGSGGNGRDGERWGAMGSGR